MPSVCSHKNRRLFYQEHAYLILGIHLALPKEVRPLNNGHFAMKNMHKSLFSLDASLDESVLFKGLEVRSRRPS